MIYVQNSFEKFHKITLGIMIGLSAAGTSFAVYKIIKEHMEYIPEIIRPYTNKEYGVRLDRFDDMYKLVIGKLDSTGDVISDGCVLAFDTNRDTMIDLVKCKGLDPVDSEISQMTSIYRLSQIERKLLERK